MLTLLEHLGILYKSFRQTGLTEWLIAKSLAKECQINCELTCQQLMQLRKQSENIYFWLPLVARQPRNLWHQKPIQENISYHLFVLPFRLYHISNVPDGQYCSSEKPCAEMWQSFGRSTYPKFEEEKTIGQNSDRAVFTQVFVWTRNTTSVQTSTKSCCYQQFLKLLLFHQ